MVATQDNANVDIGFRFIEAGGPGTAPDFVDNSIGDKNGRAVAAFVNTPWSSTGMRQSRTAISI